MVEGYPNGNGNGGLAKGSPSPFFGLGNGDGDVALELETDAAVPEAEFNGRVYHDEHFAHGHMMQPEDDVKAAPMRRVTMGTANSKNLDDRATATAYARPVTLGMPMPKWPAGHQSAAFESVAVKKSFILSPAEIYAECAHHGEEKSKFPWYKIWTLSIIAGCYVGFGYSTCLLIGGNLSQAPGIGSDEDENYGLFKLIYGAVGFPFGFTTIVVCGAELYTSLCAYMTAAWWEGKVTWKAVLYMLFVSWWGNFVGCAIMAGLFKASMVYDHHDITLLRTAQDKISHPWGATFVKGIFANWLVGIATWMANAAQDLTGKAIGIWLPISAFAMIGFEHCIASQFLFLMAWAQGANLSAKSVIWDNLIPATLGNYIGGGVCLATVYAFAFGGTPKQISNWVDAKMKKA